MEFLKERTEVSAEDTAEWMLYDLYLREKLKSRPAFETDQKPYEKAVREYLRAQGISKTAHIEVFRDKRAVLFDYTRRNPLNNNAYTEEVFL